MASIIAVMLFASGMIIMNFIKDDVTTARSSSNLNCSDLNNSDGAKVTCLGIDLVVPYTFVIIFSVIGGIIGARLVGA